MWYMKYYTPREVIYHEGEAEEIIKIIHSEMFFYILHSVIPSETLCYKMHGWLLQKQTDSTVL